ncbi:MAG: HTH-type transcriptional regulator TrpI [Candidatus Erwinia impunctatus]|nr:HTH-type transcriptional regulator TrpI [Culicoides impunctatus]
MFNHDNGEFNSQKRDRRLPSLMALRCFEAAARLENFTRAAEELHLTHGAISRAVRLLEDELSVRLFERRQRRVFLTSEGHCSGQLILATRPDCSWNSRSDSFGVKPPLYQWGRMAL